MRLMVLFCSAMAATPGRNLRFQCKEINSPLWVRLSVLRPHCEPESLRKREAPFLGDFNGLKFYSSCCPGRIAIRDRSALGGLPQLAMGVYHRAAICNHIRNQNRFIIESINQHNSRMPKDFTRIVFGNRDELIFFITKLGERAIFEVPRSPFS